ncbi:NAD(P)-dependent iron-only hydrogenase diaphorase component iron-sulfur protein [Clostridium sp. USBA 49]|uniref:NADH-quinone oxidoreductase subunit NuoE n=1 Tax=Clostridium sp. USBA 49 TaxID=1881060 RepID=UPI0009CC78CA|nr:NADH-quinone oxidoreductase subunit NuoE [Clostridium sp. USBA 49]SKA90202.1 NAD(P)-dependent iron-only hydrogenase diaphorase component iron-sulfur protein [Clostridium sp. USBA 49]
MDDKKCCCCSNEDDDRIEKVREIVKEYKGIKGSLIPILHEIQKLFGYIKEEAMQVVSEELSVPMSEIYGVATFYSQFTLEPKGKHIIKVCLGTACYVKGSQDILNKLSSLLEVEVGKTTKDGMFTLEAARCLGGCGLAPVMMIDEKVYGKLIPDDVIKIIEEVKALG